MVVLVLGGGLAVMLAAVVLLGLAAIAIVALVFQLVGQRKERDRQRDPRDRQRDPRG